VIHRSGSLSIEISPGDSSSAEPVAVPRSAGAWWLVATVMFSYLLYYFVGLDHGAVSIFGIDMHEFMHDGRHFASFPCH
jgi:cobalt transporter subunit CbtB